MSVAIDEKIQQHGSTKDEESSLWTRLKSGTRDTHGRLDNRIMEGRPFESVERYGDFVLMQHDFHMLVSPLYQHEELAPLLPDLKIRDRISKIEQDLFDLDRAVPVRETPHVYQVDVPTSLGWLYVAEGSNLGAAFLLKSAQKLGLSDQHGARHLGGAPEGRGLHWKKFTAALDAIALTAEQEARVIAGANEAFSTVLGLVEKRLFARGAD
ncbi:MAG: biliverdin-producing heme oxygenase [Candidatus Devosia phytovorans]|uniref:Biliverdin-producing heme oxygenase n=1 Tax=Candidatus Devosia phytovorans TaxID=3121372 RepID=A0AAJ5VW61_9HYPH|nr:biliverdin-producing heme oxygenase [Devosia sp.]WEK06028.1 MAG: biliverdin-producing heme oxygenase [Devosia sp.]